MANDSLARGAKSAQFPSLSHVSDEKWNLAFGKSEKEKPAKKKPLKTVWSK